jgi:hypothetical protein
MSSSLSPTALELADAAKILSKLFAQPVTEAMLREDIAAGAPTNPDGTLNLVHYAGWLAREVAHAD